MADFQDPKDLEHYLKTAAELECSAYRLEKSIEVAEDELKPLYEKDSTKGISAPRLKEVAPPKPPEPPTKPFDLWDEANAGKATAAYTWLIVRLLLWGVLGVWLIGSWAMESWRILRLLLGMLILIITFARYYISATENSPSARRKEKEEYDKSLLQHKKAMIKYEKEDLAKYKEEEAKRKAEFVKEEEKYNRKIEEAKSLNEQRKKKIDATHNGVLAMQKTLAETKDTLKKVYSINVVHPKYQNMVAMCSIYEYFETGRCTSLKGADGAYNMYEAELRQNLIIGRLDTIIKKLDTIKNNQYTLYCELRETNRILQSISQEVASISSATDSIASSAYLISRQSSITAVCAQATAKNTEALKYIALVS